MVDKETQLRLERDKLAEACEVLLNLLQEKQARLHEITDELRELKGSKFNIKPL